MFVHSSTGSLRNGDGEPREVIVPKQEGVCILYDCSRVGTVPKLHRLEVLVSCRAVDGKSGGVAARTLYFEGESS
jgi:hypothetical protein